MLYLEAKAHGNTSPRGPLAAIGDENASRAPALSKQGASPWQQPTITYPLRIIASVAPNCPPMRRSRKHGSTSPIAMRYYQYLQGSKIAGLWSAPAVVLPNSIASSRRCEAGRGSGHTRQASPIVVLPGNHCQLSESQMPQYYFDVRDGNHLTVDKEGFELPNIVCARQEAARSLAEMA